MLHCHCLGNLPRISQMILSIKVAVLLAPFATVKYVLQGGLTPKIWENMRIWKKFRKRVIHIPIRWSNSCFQANKKPDGNDVFAMRAADLRNRRGGGGGRVMYMEIIQVERNYSTQWYCNTTVITCMSSNFYFYSLAQVLCNLTLTYWKYSPDSDLAISWCIYASGLVTRNVKKTSSIMRTTCSIRVTRAWEK